MADENQQAAPTQNSDQPPGESNVKTFQQRTLDRLQAETRPTQLQPKDEENVISQDEAVPDDAHQPVEQDLDQESPLLEQPTGDQADTGVVNTDVEDVDGEQDIANLRQRATEAEAMISSMQTDYTRKTQALGESRRELLSNLEQSEKLSGIYAERASQSLGRYANVNWQQLQSTLDPQVYNTRLAEYHKAVGDRDREVAAHEQVKNFVTDQVEKNNQAAAEISRDVLRTTIPGWGNDLYGTLREHAVSNLGYSQKEFDAFTDHRMLRLIHNDWKVSDTGARVEHIQHNGSRQRQPTGGPNKQQPRGADGRYREAQEKHLANPGNRDFTREAFRERLSRERTSR